MAKKTSPKKTIKEEVVTQPVGTESDSQFDVIPVDEVPQTDIIPETPEPTPVLEVAPPDITSETPEPMPVVETQPEVPAATTAEVKPETIIPPKPKPLTMVGLKAEIDDLRKTLDAQAILIAQLLTGPILKRKPATNGNNKVQIKDKTTGKIYPSKNNCYQSLLKAGDLKEMVDKNLLGDIPAKNNFGVYAMNRYFQNRFEEIKPEIVEAKHE